MGKRSSRLVAPFQVFFGDLSSIGCLGRKGVAQVGADETVKAVIL